MKLTKDELEYILTVLQRTSSYTIARAEQIDMPAVSHKRLIQKVKDSIYRLEL